MLKFTNVLLLRYIIENVDIIQNTRQNYNPNHWRKRLMENNYKRAFKEIVEILKYVPNNKIYEKNIDNITIDFNNIHPL